MRYVDGTDLGALLAREGRLTQERAVGIVSQVSAALDAAHAQGLVHRDVKPGNILLAAVAEGENEHVYLTDFGVAKQTRTAGLTRTGFFLGTIDSAAPEQIESKEIDGRTDVYALGCVLYQCLTGSLPYEKRLRDRCPLCASQRAAAPAVRAVARAVAAVRRRGREGTREIAGRSLRDVPRPLDRSARCAQGFASGRGSNGCCGRSPDADRSGTHGRRPPSGSGDHSRAGPAAMVAVACGVDRRRGDRPRRGRRGDRHCPLGRRWRGNQRRCFHGHRGNVRNGDRGDCHRRHTRHRRRGGRSRLLEPA